VEHKAQPWSLPEDDDLSSSDSILFTAVTRFFLPTLLVIGGNALFLARR
jgi:hypothetical protein